jgi:hypothetical protein
MSLAAAEGGGLATPIRTAAVARQTSGRIGDRLAVAASVGRLLCLCRSKAAREQARHVPMKIRPDASATPAASRADEPRLKSEAARDWAFLASGALERFLPILE